MASPVAFRTRRHNSAVSLTTLAAAKNQSTCGLRLAVPPEAEYSWIPMMHSRLALLGWLSLLSLVSGAGIRGADAKIDREDVLVSSPQGSGPRFLRYDFVDVPRYRLWNKAGLPAAPFESRIGP